MKRNNIKVNMYHDGKYWCARCLDIDVFTQGKTLDMLVENLKEAIAVHLGSRGRHSQTTVVSLMELNVA